uniref:Type II methyltransferase M.BanIII n=1 Tax=Aneurinibacillus aneurinilyticus TaxID=1391 RepID=MTB3_ANEAE|nr:RecName: Full=Type II methyltransferase M.BanIII; Short=M.BanIII; AltName: Full=Adenine-specific methyltransferase BanIII; AltName: Full=Modification methylase BanIII [Aneurinibacillus aneurinilyticus]
MELTIEEMLIKQKETGAHYTPTDLGDIIAKRLINELKKSGISGTKKIRGLDPSCGDGELLLSLNRMGKFNNIDNIELIGIDEDKEAIKEADFRLNEMGINDAKLSGGDFLDMVDLEGNLSLFDDDLSKIEPVDLIIANPPYVRTQVLGADRAQKLAKLFNLKGRVDLYHAFLVAMTLQLKPGGLIGVITSNKYLANTTGESIRQFLAENYDIIEIMDLGDTKLFSGAVLQAIFFGTKKLNKGIRQTAPANFYKIYEETDPSKTEVSIKFETLFGLLESSNTGVFNVDEKFYSVSCGKLIVPDSFKEPWVMATDEEYNWITNINNNSYCTIQDLCDLKVGIKTTADKVFIKSTWEELPDEIKPEVEVLKLLISTDHASKWRPLERIGNQKILYTHENLNGKKKAIHFTQYPHALAYLETHRETLEGRKYVIKAKRNWYQIWLPQNPDHWALPKILFPDISPEPKFFYEDEGCCIDGNCYWIIPKEENNNDILFLILGISNTKYMTNYHDIAFNNKLYPGRTRYLTQYVSNYPLPNPEANYSQEIIDVLRELLFQNPNDERKIEIENQIENLTALAFGVERL